MSISSIQRPNAPSSGVGALTSANRDLWSDARKELEDLGNEQALEKIDSAIYAICLDDLEYTSEEPNKVVSELCCGSNPENRWFDKSV